MDAVPLFLKGTYGYSRRPIWHTSKQCGHGSSLFVACKQLSDLKRSDASIVEPIKRSLCLYAFNDRCRKMKLRQGETSSISSRYVDSHATRSSFCRLKVSPNDSTSSGADVIHKNKSAQLEVLDAYFDKLNGVADKQETSESSVSSLDQSERGISSYESQSNANLSKTRLEINSLDNYFSTLASGMRQQADVLVSEEKITEEAVSSVEASLDVKGSDSDFLLEVAESSQLFDNENAELTEASHEGSDLNLISTLVAINIGVLLFEVASPVKGFHAETSSLPLLYGGKVNDLILNGEWWRLVTPMFLHSGIFHVAAGCWGLLTFGPEVCRVYGPFTFFLIYLLGGICGNMTSFLHTPELTVGGTGPVFAVIGAWMVFQMQNKDAAAKDTSETLFQKASVIVALSFLLSGFSNIDDWTHLGAACAGLLYGYLVTPVVEMDDSPLRNSRQEGVAVVGRWIDPCRSFFIFCSIIFAVASIVLLFETEVMPFDTDIDLP